MASSQNAGTAVHGNGGRLAKVARTASQATIVQAAPITSSDQSFVGCICLPHLWLVASELSAPAPILTLSLTSGSSVTPVASAPALPSSLATGPNPGRT